MPKRHTEAPDLETQRGRLRWAREQAGFTSIRSAAVAHGWNENTYKSHEQGMRQADGLKTKYIQTYARAFRVSQAWLATGKGDPLRPDLTAEEIDAARRLLRSLDR